MNSRVMAESRLSTELKSVKDCNNKLKERFLEMRNQISEFTKANSGLSA